MILKVLSNVNDSMILWFYSSMTWLSQPARPRQLLSGNARPPSPRGVVCPLPPQSSPFRQPDRAPPAVWAPPLRAALPFPLPPRAETAIGAVELCHARKACRDLAGGEFALSGRVGRRAPTPAVAIAVAMPAAMSPAAPTAQEALEIAGRIIDRQIQDDRCYPDLSELLAVPAPGEEHSVALCLLLSSPRPPRCPGRTATPCRSALAGAAWPATRGGPRRAASGARSPALGGSRPGKAPGTQRLLALPSQGRWQG